MVVRVSDLTIFPNYKGSLDSASAAQCKVLWKDENNLQNDCNTCIENTCFTTTINKNTSRHAESVNISWL